MDNHGGREGFGRATGGEVSRGEVFDGGFNLAREAEVREGAESGVEREVRVPVTDNVVKNTEIDEEATIPGVVEKTGPETAKDEDKMEKEWAEIALQAIRRTVGDPYSRNSKIMTLGEEYRVARWGRHTGDRN